jgi:hypothetical protein
MSNDQQLSKEKSLEIIHQMINQAKANVSDNGIGWLLWGTMIFLASLSTYIFLDIGAENIFLGWNIFGAFTIIMLIYDAFKPRKKAVRTYMDDLMKMVHIGFFICIFVIILAINIAVSPNSGFAFLLMIFAFLMLIVGGAIKARSLIVGAVVNWIGSIAILFNKEFKYDMLIMAAAVLIGYIIPGLLLRAQYKKDNRNAKK